LYAEYNFVCKAGLEGAGEEKDVCGVYLPIVCKLEAEFKCKQVTCWEYNCAISKPILPRERASI